MSFRVASLFQRAVSPHLWYDPLRLARRGRVTQLRVIFLITLLAGLMVAHYVQPVVGDRNQLARLAQTFTFVFFVLQNIMIVLLAPVYFGGAIAEEKERGTLDLLFTTRLGDGAIALGILGGRVVLVGGLMVAGLPILAALQWWGGVDMELILGNELFSLLLLVTVGAGCLMISALNSSATWAVTICYGLVLLPLLLCHIPGAHYLVLYDDRSGGRGQATVQVALGYLLLGAGLSWLICLAWARNALRISRWHRPESAVLAAPAPLGPFGTATPRNDPAGNPVEPSPFLHRLPPVGDHGLLWKECFTGGQLAIYSPYGCSLLSPLGLTALAFLAMVTAIASIDQTNSVGREFAGFLYFVYLALLIFYFVGLMLRATASVARERERRTLDLLLQIPCEPADILLAKWVGALWRGYPYLVLAGLVVLLQLYLGVVTKPRALVCLVAPLPLLLFYGSLAMFLSVVTHTVLRARLWLIVFLVPSLWLYVIGIVNPMDPQAVYFGRGSTSQEEWEIQNGVWRFLVITFYMIGTFYFMTLALVYFSRRDK